MTHEDHVHDFADRATGTRAQRAITDGVLCGSSCPYLRKTFDGESRCEAFGSEPMIERCGRSLRCRQCWIGERLFRGAR